MRFIEEGTKAARALNPNLIMLGEGWRTYAGDENTPVQPADQDFWMKTDTKRCSFSDDIRNKSSSLAIQTKVNLPLSQVA